MSVTHPEPRVHSPNAAAPASSAVTLVLLASAGHSGSTLLDLLLGNHPDISGAGEMNRLTLYPEERICTCGAAVNRCVYWSQVRARLAAAAGTGRSGWDGWHTDVPPQAPVVSIEGVDWSTVAPGGPVPEVMSAALGSKGIRLSPTATMTVGGTRDVKWRIVDTALKQTLVVRRSDERTHLYAPLLEWKNPLRRLGSPLELVLAAGLDAAVPWLARVSGPTARALETAHNSWRVAEAMAAVDGTRMVVDSSKSAIRLKLLHLVRPQAVRVIHLVRDGRAVAASAMRRKQMSAATAARIWVRENQHLELVLRRVSAAQKQRVRYEDLCEHPERELSRVCQFLGVPFAPGMLSLWERPVHNIPGNPMLFEKSRRAITRDERWRRDLSADDLAAIAREAGRINRAYGYA